MLTPLAHLVINFDKSVLTLYLSSLSSLVEVSPDEGVINALSLRVCDLGSTTHLQKNHFQAGGHYHQDFIKVMVAVIVKDEVEQGVRRNVFLQKFAEKHNERVGH